MTMMPRAGRALPWLAGLLREAWRTQQGHALLIHGSQGVGQFDLVLALAAAWLCESTAKAQPAFDGVACGVCPSCRMVQAGSHPDLMVLLPQALREAIGWGADDEQDDGGGKRKPSQEIRVDDVRRIVGFAQATAARGAVKVVVLFPAERMNAIAANALLKTLEEPPGALRFALAGSSTDTLLPTVRSRCQRVTLPLPETDVAANWLAGQGVTQPEVLLAAAGGQPEEALAWSQDGLDAMAWLAIPAQLAAGDAAGLTGHALPWVLDVMLKLCHDSMRRAADAPPRYFPASVLGTSFDMPGLTRWHVQLLRVARHADHPWQLALSLDMLVQQARVALTPPTPSQRNLPSRRDVVPIN
jgi:DNA polymerase-3 subunit delta'